MKLVKYDNGYALKIEPESYNHWHSVSDFDEYLADSFGWIAKRLDTNIRESFFESNNSLGECLESYFDEYQDGVGLHIRKTWELAKAELKGTHVFDEPNETNQLFWDVNATKIYKDIWEPVVKSHLEWVKNASEENFQDFLNSVDDNLVLTEFDFVRKMALPKNGEEVFVAVEQPKWVELLQSTLTQHAESITLKQLDAIICFYTFGDHYCFDWDVHTNNTAACFFDKYQETIFQYIQLHPNLTAVALNGNQGGGTSASSVYGNDDLSNVEGILVSDDYCLRYELTKGQTERTKKGMAAARRINYLNDFLDADFYTTEVVFVVPEGQKHLYPEAEYDPEFKQWVVGNIEDCGGFLGIETAEENFEYYKDLLPLTPTYNYSKLGQVTVAKFN